MKSMRKRFSIQETGFFSSDSIDTSGFFSSFRSPALLGDRLEADHYDHRTRHNSPMVPLYHWARSHEKKLVPPAKALRHVLELRLLQSPKAGRMVCDDYFRYREL
jgi:hypothetical protein